MNKNKLIEEINLLSEVTWARSGGPGGQNVNKVNSKIIMFLSIDKLSALSEEEKIRVKKGLSSKINKNKELYIHVQEERSQILNKEIAYQKLYSLIINSLHRPKKRRITKPTKGSKERRLQAKKIKSSKKTNRRAPIDY